MGGCGNVALTRRWVPHLCFKMPQNSTIVKKTMSVSKSTRLRGKLVAISLLILCLLQENRGKPATCRFVATRGTSGGVLLVAAAICASANFAVKWRMQLAKSRALGSKECTNNTVWSFVQYKMGKVISCVNVLKLSPLQCQGNYKKIVKAQLLQNLYWYCILTNS